MEESLKKEPPLPRRKRKNNPSLVLPQTIKSAERAAQALRLRKEGYSYRQIAQKMRCPSANVVSKMIFRALRNLHLEAGPHVLTLELARLDDLQAAVWERAVAGEIPYQMAVLKIMERRSAYLGLDAPPKIDAHPVGTVELRLRWESEEIPSNYRVEHDPFRALCPPARETKTGGGPGGAAMARGAEAETSAPGQDRGADDPLPTP